MKEYKSVNIRDIDAELFRLARAEALKKDMKIGHWINQAIEEKLERDGMNK